MAANDNKHAYKHNEKHQVAACVYRTQIIVHRKQEMLDICCVFGGLCCNIRLIRAVNVPHYSR